jgi:hypothetical protein
MPHQNRVDPRGEIHAVAPRGAWFGNKGCIHDAQGRVNRAFRGTRWIICTLTFKDRRRRLLQPGCYTELFFLDEATAMAAGHRPCMECRRADALRYMELAGFRRLSELDEALHLERLGPVLMVDSASLPIGAMVADGSESYLVVADGLRRWSFEGYGATEPHRSSMRQLTPPMSVRVLRGAYSVQIG